MKYFMVLVQIFILTHSISFSLFSSGNSSQVTANKINKTKDYFEIEYILPELKLYPINCHEELSQTIDDYGCLMTKSDTLKYYGVSIITIPKTDSLHINKAENKAKNIALMNAHKQLNSRVHSKIDVHNNTTESTGIITNDYSLFLNNEHYKKLAVWKLNDKINIAYLAYIEEITDGKNFKD